MSKSETLNQSNGINRYWSCPAEDVLNAVGGSVEGISSAAAAERLKTYGRNILIHSQRGLTVIPEPFS